MLPFIPALMVGLDLPSIIIVIAIFATPLFFIIRWMLRKTRTSAERKTITIISIVSAIVLAPIVAWLTIIGVITLLGIQ